ncbi:MAG: hypothetical protein ACPL7B_03330 [Candidatus Poribacteria bacterium]
MTDKDDLKEFDDLIHKLNHNLTLVYSYIDISIQYLNNETKTKEDIIQLLGEAQKTYDDVKDIIMKIAEKMSKLGSKNDD